MANTRANRQKRGNSGVVKDRREAKKTARAGAGAALAQTTSRKSRRISQNTKASSPNQQQKSKAPARAAPAGGHQGAGDDDGSGHEDEEEDEETLDLATARPREGARVSLKHVEQPKEKGPGRRKRVTWLSGKVDKVRTRGQTMSVVLDQEHGGHRKTGLAWDSDEVRFEDGDEPQRPDLDDVDEKMVTLLDTLHTWMTVHDKTLRRAFMAWAAHVGGEKNWEERRAALAAEREEKLKLRELKLKKKPGGKGAGKAAVKGADKATVTAATGRKERKGGRNLPRPGRTGIRNLGNTCYMSSVVQSLASIPKFRDIIMNYPKYSTISTGDSDGRGGSRLVRTNTVAILEEHKKIPSRRSSEETKVDETLTLCQPMSELMRVLWTGKLLVATPHRLLAAVYKLQERFAGYEQQDAQDFLYFVLDQTVEELAPELQPDYANTLKSLFGGQFESSLQCSSCSHRTTRQEPFMDLSLDFPPKPQGGPKANQPRSLDDCLAHFVRAETVEDYKCENCKQKCDFEKMLRVQEFPPVLVLHLKRWKTDFKVGRNGDVTMVRKKDTSKIIFEEEIDMMPYSAGAVPTMSDDDDDEEGPEDSPVLRRTRSSSEHGSAAIQKKMKMKTAAGGGGGANKPPKLSLLPMSRPATTPITEAAAAAAGEGAVRYRLRATVVHHGSGLGTGHYTAFARPGPAVINGVVPEAVAGASATLLAQVDDCTATLGPASSAGGGRQSLPHRASLAPVDEEEARLEASEWVEFNDMVCRRPVQTEEVLRSNAYMLLYERIEPADDPTTPTSRVASPDNAQEWQW